MERHKAIFMLPFELNDRLARAALDRRTSRVKLVIEALEGYLDECDRLKDLDKQEQESQALGTAKQVAA